MPQVLTLLDPTTMVATKPVVVTRGTNEEITKVEVEFTSFKLVGDYTRNAALDVTTLDWSVVAI